MLIDNSPSKRRTPLYKQCAIKIRQQILDGKWEPGEMLPSEKEFTKEFNVSRITIRQAMDLLEQDQLIIKQQGKGTFIPQKIIEEDFNVHGFVRNSTIKGYKADFALDTVQVVLPSKQIQKSLQLSKDEEVYNIKRIKFENDKPLMYERIFLPYKYAPNITFEHLSKKWISHILWDDFSIKINKATYTIEPIIIDEFEANKLLTPPKTLGLLIDRLSWSNDEIVLFTRSIVRSDLIKYSIEVNNLNF